MLVCYMHAGDGYKVVRQRLEGHFREEIAKIPLSQFPAPSWIHDFPITENYAIVPEMPVYFNMLVCAPAYDSSSAEQLTITKLQ